MAFELDSNIYNKAREMALSERLGAQTGELNDEKIKQAKVERAAGYLNMATPENWQAVRSKAISEGLGDEQTIPQQYDANWVSRVQQAFASHRQDVPNAIQEYSFYNKLGTKEEKQTYMDVKRAQPYLNIGGSFMQPSADGGVRNEIPKTVSPDQQPELKGAQKDAQNASDLKYEPVIAGAKAKETEVGKYQGEQETNLTNDVATLPQLEQTVAKLSELGKKATYTNTGNVANAVVRETGPLTGKTSTEGAVARTEYMAQVDNQILPLLRRTFGAQFTLQEGRDLRATLGAPDKSPEEKEAVLRAFIDQKKANIETAKRATNPTLQTTVPVSNSKKAIMDKYGLQ